MQCIYIQTEEKTMSLVQYISNHEFKDEETIEVDENGTSAPHITSYECLAGPAKYEPTEKERDDYCLTDTFNRCPRYSAVKK